MEIKVKRSEQGLRSWTNLEILMFYDDLKGLRNVTGHKLLYSIKRTKDWLKPIAEALSQESLIPKSEGFKAYEDEVREFYEEKAKNPDGTRRTKDILVEGKISSQLDIDVTDPVTKAEKAKIELKHDNDIKERDAQIKEYNETLNEISTEEVRLYKLPLKYFPQEIETFSVLEPLISDLPPALDKDYEDIIKRVLDNEKII